MTDRKGNAETKTMGARTNQILRTGAVTNIVMGTERGTGTET